MYYTYFIYINNKWEAVDYSIYASYEGLKDAYII